MVFPSSVIAQIGEKAEALEVGRLETELDVATSLPARRSQTERPEIPSPLPISRGCHPSEIGIATSRRIAAPRSESVDQSTSHGIVGVETDENGRLPFVAPAVAERPFAPAEPLPLPVDDSTSEDVRRVDGEARRVLRVPSVVLEAEAPAFDK